MRALLRRGRRHPWLLVSAVQLSKSYSSGVRVRFAPSPTGQLHIGGFRSALYNYLFAKRAGGAFILRIEDTDQSRLVPGAPEALQSMLEWSGVTPDEGPAVGGPRGPYVQSQRLGLYRDAVDDLLARGKAYRCFCSDRRLSLLKKEAAKARVHNRYDGRCKELSPQEVADNLGKGLKHTVRLDTDDCDRFSNFDDLVYGPFKHTGLAVEGDPILFKSDGFPVYHLANVVDDHHMQISHVFRGVEWQVSTPKHLMLYDALGWKPPEFGHLPLIMNADGTKLSKRQGDVHLEDFKAKGYFAEAVANFITLSGGGFHDRDVINEGTNRFYSLQELVDRFDHTLLKTNNTKLDFDKLKVINQRLLVEKANDPGQVQSLLDQVKQSIGLNSSSSQRSLEDDAVLAGHLKWLAGEGRINTMADLADPNNAFLWAGPKTIDYNGPVTSDVLAKVVKAVNSCAQTEDLKAETVVKALRELAEAEDIKFPELMKCLRSVLSGLKKGPPVGEMVQHLGLQTTLRRLQHAVAVFSNKP